MGFSLRAQSTPRPNAFRFGAAQRWTNGSIWAISRTNTQMRRRTLSTSRWRWATRRRMRRRLRARPWRWARAWTWAFMSIGRRALSLLRFDYCPIRAAEIMAAFTDSKYLVRLSDRD